MQPASDRPTESSTALRRYGPIAAIVVVIALIAGIVLLGGGDDDETTATEGDTAVEQDDGEAPEVTSGDGEVVYPLSYREAEEAGIAGDHDWGERCDTDRGQVAMPNHFAAECYLPFEGDNGGETAQGVTADSIKIVVYLGPDDDPVINYITDAIQVDDTNADTKDSLSHWVDMLETYYETYGREVEIEYYESNGIASDAVTARADAVQIAEDMAPFQVWGGPALTSAFGEELAARGIQCLSCGLTPTHEQLIERDGMFIGGGLSNEQARRHNVEVLVKQVAGRPAVHAGDPAMQDQERVFGYLYIESSEESARSAEAYRDALADRGVELAEMVPYNLDPATLQETAGNAIAKLKQAGVTTVVFAGDPIAPRDFTREATAQDYRPEWFLNLSTLIDTNVFSRQFDQEQWGNAFGITSLAARVDPDIYSSYHIYEWFYGEEAAADGTLEVVVPTANRFFEILQGVGPDLTHDTFIESLFAYEEPATGVHSANSSWGDHGHWPGLEAPDWEGIDDVTKIWWDPTAEGPDEIFQEGAGLWQYVDGGQRYYAEEWREEEFKAFDPEGTSDIYETHPEGTEPPDYEPLDVKSPSA